MPSRLTRVPVVVVGAGPAGVAAAVQLHRLGIQVRLVDSAGEAGGLARCARRIENYPGFEPPLSGEELVQRFRAQLNNVGLRLETMHVSALKPRPQGVTLISEQGSCAARYVVLAVGTRAKQLRLPETGDPISPPIHYDVRSVLKQAPSRVAIVGGGEAAFDSALSLADQDAEVLLALRASAPRARGTLLAEVNAHPRVSIYRNCAVEELRRGAHKTEVVVRAQGRRQTWHVDALLGCIGRKSNAPALLDGSRYEEGQVLVIGDARRGRLGQVGIAVGDGLEAAAKIAFVSDLDDVQ